MQDSGGMGARDLFVLPLIFAQEETVNHKGGP